MVTTKDEAMQLILILLRHISKKNAVLLLKEMDKEVGSATKNESLKNSLNMAYRLLGEAK
jgi:hypothetical protein|tara:strand:- start:1292 stop:1471 length:180 start_codon:yes stop_codon:yes gene_type:complete